MRVILNDQGHVAECTGDNIFIVEDSQVATPPLSAGILPGITRAVVIDLARKSDLPAVEEDITAARVLRATECFLTGTAAEVIAVTKVDDQPIGDGEVGPVTRKLSAAFHEYIASGEWD